MAFQDLASSTQKKEEIRSHSTWIPLIFFVQDNDVDRASFSSADYREEEHIAATIIQCMVRVQIGKNLLLLELTICGTIRCGAIKLSCSLTCCGSR
jgi:hypothetical protein